MSAVLAFILVLGVLIFVHELGHFVVAKLAGVRVEIFSLGFGPRLLWFTRGETEYRICILPLGGYVKMTGESVDEEVSVEDREKSFTHKPLSKRVPIVIAGSVMNLLLAVVLFPLVYMLGLEVPAFLDSTPVISYIDVDGSAYREGLRDGDIIKAVSGAEIDSWEEFLLQMAIDPERSLELTMARGTETIEITLAGGEYLGISPPMSPLIGNVAKDSAAERAGFMYGDTVLAIDGQTIGDWRELRDLLKDSSQQRVFVVKRDDGAEAELTVVPELDEDSGNWRIGITYLQETVFKRYTPVRAVEMGLERAYKMTVLLFEVIRGLFTGEYSMKTLGGPIMIAQVAGQAAETGTAELLLLMAFLSLQLGIINLFPIPVLDGGLLVFFAVEFVIGRPLSDRVIGVAQTIGLVLLVALMLVVTRNDILRIFGML